MTSNRTFFAILISASMIVFAAFDDQKQKPFIAKVVYVYDGDSIRVKAEQKYYEIRLASIDAPEYTQNFGQICRAKLNDLIDDKLIKIEPRTTDRYKRIVADIKLGNLNINREMVKSGCAWAYRKYLYDQTLIAIEKNAQNEKLGLWAQPKSHWIPPWKTRQ